MFGMLKIYWYVNCDGNMYLPILHLPRVELHRKLQEKLHCVTGPSDRSQLSMSTQSLFRFRVKCQGNHESYHVVGVRYSDENDVCGDTLSLYRHRASWKVC